MKGSTNKELREIIDQNNIQMAKILERMDILKDAQNHLIDMVNRHEKEIDKLQMLAEPIKCKIPKEQKWIGFLCKFKDHRDQDWQHYDILEAIDYASTNGIFEDRIGNHWQICEVVHLTDKEVYKVSLKDLEPLSKEEVDILDNWDGIL